MKDERTFTVNEKNYLIKKPTSRVSQEAQRVYSSEFMKSLEQGLMVKAKLKKFLQDHGVWTEEQEKEEERISKKINQLEVELYKGGKDKKRISLAEGKAKAIEMKDLRLKYAQLIAERQSYESNTAESMADNARFDFLVSECTFNEDGTKVYSSYEDYQVRSNEELAYEAASTLAQFLYSLEDDFAKKLPENQFLLRFGLVDDELRLVNSKGHLVDKEGRLIDENGYYVDENGQRVDREGNRLSEDGLLDLDVVYVDDEGNPVEPSKEKEEKVEVSEVEEEAQVPEPTTEAVEEKTE